MGHFPRNNIIRTEEQLPPAQRLRTVVLISYDDTRPQRSRARFQAEPFALKHPDRKSEYESPQYLEKATFVVAMRCSVQTYEQIMVS